jgi:TIR domain
VHDEDSVEVDAPAFFLSYARPQSQSTFGAALDFDNPVFRLFNDLCVRVNQAIRMPVGMDVGFIDANLEVGVQWRPELLRMIGTCTVFVALLSEPYLYDSKWCPMEWHLFKQREVRPKKGYANISPNSSAILPVLWTPIYGDFPPVVEAAERFMPADLPPEYLARYQRDGLLGARDISIAAYTALVSKIARHIQIVRATRTVVPLVKEDTSGLPDTFWGGTA